ILKYEDDEYEAIKKILEQLGLEVRETQNGFGVGQKLLFFKEKHEELLNYLLNTATFNNVNNINIIDDINKELVNNNCVNIAIFRVLPDHRGEVCIELKRLITILELKNIIQVYSCAYEILINAVINKQVEIKVA
ncbi:MAG: hypothetical protein QXL14_00490, partial [Candidatus Aenigmatarchaeota archaeon]